MDALLDNPKGNYCFLAGIAPYSSGVVAMPGYEIVHATFQHPLPYRQGFEWIHQHLTTLGRPRAALCAIELRLPAPLSFAGFAEFNQGYQALLEKWDLLVEGQNPVARTNVAPVIEPPAEPSLYAYSFTIPTGTGKISPTFVIAGAGELTGSALSPQAVVRAGETTAEAMQEKAAHVLRTMQARLHSLGRTWSDVTTVDIYTAHPIHSFLASEILQNIGPTAIHGVHWFLSRPPIADLEFEMDLRGVRKEVRLR
ncbi:MAG: 2-amino-5-chloromuconate deaminase CnbZ [Anaerolineae bacterium]